VVPNDGATTVLLTTNTFTVYYNQPMRVGGGGGSADRLNNYLLYRRSDGRKITLLSVTYNPTAYTATITFGNTQVEWTENTWFVINIFSGIQNACGVNQGATVVTAFKTTFTRTSTPTPTGTLPTATATPTGTPTCSAPLSVNGNLPDGYVTSVTPPDGTQNVPLTTATITIQFNQPMNSTSGGGRVTDINRYALRRVSDNGNVRLLGVVYDPINYSITLTIDLADQDWQLGTWYYLEVDDKVENICRTQQGDQVYSFFKTDGPPAPMPVFRPGTAVPEKTDVPQPSPTPSPMPTATVTLTRTRTATSAPTHTPLPTSTRTSTPFPTATLTPVPTVPPTPQPEKTYIPPSATSAPEK
jgi:hypothetical protein